MRLECHCTLSQTPSVEKKGTAPSMCGALCGCACDVWCVHFWPVLKQECEVWFLVSVFIS